MNIYKIMSVQSTQEDEIGTAADMQEAIEIARNKIRVYGYKPDEIEIRTNMEEDGCGLVVYDTVEFMYNIIFHVYNSNAVIFFTRNPGETISAEIQFDGCADFSETDNLNSWLEEVESTAYDAGINLLYAEKKELTKALEYISGIAPHC